MIFTKNQEVIKFHFRHGVDHFFTLVISDINYCEIRIIAKNFRNEREYEKLYYSMILRFHKISN